MILDYQHVWCQDGVWERSANSVMTALKKLRKLGRKELPTWQDVHAAQQFWTWPKSAADGKRVCEGNKLSCTSSEALSAAPVFVYYFREVVEPLGGVSALIDTFVKACTVMEVLQAVNRSEHTTPTLLCDTTLAFLRSHAAVHGMHNLVYRFHQSLHLPYQWEVLRAAAPHLAELPLLSCFALERKHKFTKKQLKDRSKPMSFERGVMEELTLDHWHEWDSDEAVVDDMVALREPTRAEQTMIVLAFPRFPADGWRVSIAFRSARGENCPIKRSTAARLVRCAVVGQCWGISWRRVNPTSRGHQESMLGLPAQGLLLFTKGHERHQLQRSPNAE
jgi:hypothetical protein